MTFSLIGDSLTAGNLGIPYFRYLRLPPEGQIANHGKDGDTILGVLSRINQALATDEVGITVLEIGANDILLPKMAARGGLWKTFTDNLISSGSEPTPNPAQFETLFGKLLRIAGDAGPDKVIVTTIPPIGEDLDSELNGLRESFNARIRRAVESYSANNPAVRLADAAVAFEEELRVSGSASPWFVNEPNDFIKDARRIRRGGAAELSKERGLHLTMDGIHLNEKGALLLADVFNGILTG